MNNKNKFLEIYSAAYNNAAELLGEAEILIDRNRYARAYFLAFTALEEISKSQLAADAYTGFIDEQEFWDIYTSHKRKIGRMAWASNDAQRYLDVETEEFIPIHEPEVKRRMSALYVECNQPTVEMPSQQITAEMAKSIIHTVRVAFERIVEMTELWGHQIGTKGFMK